MIEFQAAFLVLAGFGLAFWAGYAWATRQRGSQAIPPSIVSASGGTSAADADLGWVAALPDAALVLSAEGLILLANVACEELLGPLPIGASIDWHLRQPQIRDALDQVRRTGRAATRDVMILAPQERSLRIRVTPFRDPAPRVLITVHDLTREQLTDRMRVDFVANASHELRTPLATLIGFIETLQSDAGEDESLRARFLAIMANESQRMVRLIDDLMALSRIELDKYVRPITPLALRPVIEDVHNSLTMRLKADRRVLNIDADEDLPDVIADRDQLIQVLHNLVDNAIKYGREGTPIRIHATRRDAAVVDVSVSDQGEGISAEHLPRLTERFYRVDTARSREQGGTGLGLAIVKHIVERHRGTLEIDSLVGSGTTIRFTLPIASAESVADALPGNPEPSNLSSN